VGSGLFGSVFAHSAKLKNKKVLILDKRNHIGGNVFTSNFNGINVHEYGSHIWHTASKEIHDYMSQFCVFNNYVHRGKVFYKNKIFSFPINLFTLNQLWGVTNPADAQKILDQKKIPIENPRSLEDFALSQVGEEIYEIFIKGYTIKQWGKNPSDLPASFLKRIPIRLNFNDRYYHDNDKFEGIPVGGYTPIIEKMISEVEVKLNEDFFESKKILERLSDKIIYTGPLDQFFDYSEGKLEYRSLKFEKEFLKGDYQGCSVVNYTDKKIPYTRILEHKHFEFNNSEHTVITKEYPQDYNGSNEPYYPINNEENKKLADTYRFMSKIENKYYFGGRLATYNYYDMHQVVASSLALAKKLL
jgi:UDP-galactopyranose mutase